MIPTGFFLLISSFLANSLRSLVLYSFFRRITPAQKFNKTSPLAVKTTGASVVFILEPIITKVIWLRNHVGIYYQYKKTSHKERLFCIGEQESTKIGSKSVININFFVEHRSEILAMKEQVQMIRSFIHA